MTTDPSGRQEPFEPEFHFSKGQRVRIVEGPSGREIRNVFPVDAKQRPRERGRHIRASQSTR
jgi:hypothetical protein